jgi:heme/copper-type cytochrome/quinol oxidase subunit 2
VRSPARIAVALAALLAAVVLFLVLRPDSAGEGGATTRGAETAAGTAGEETGTTPAGTTTVTGPRAIRLTIPAGGPQGIQRVRVEQDERVVLLIRSAVVDHAHLHGYDLLADVAPGRTARIAFRADVPGRFEIELEDRGEQFAELIVAP